MKFFNKSILLTDPPPNTAASQLHRNHHFNLVYKNILEEQELEAHLECEDEEEEGGRGDEASIKSAKYRRRKMTIEPLLRLGPPFLVTDSVKLEDEMKLKEEMKKELHKENLANNPHSPGEAHENIFAHVNNTSNNKDGILVKDMCLNDNTHLFTTSILEKIHAPIDRKHGGKTYRQKISNACTIRSDVIALKNELDKRLKESGAEEAGLCRTRRDLYKSCFDEIIRQVSINCADRGNLLIAIRDEINATFGAYESLFCSAVAFGLRRQLTHENKVEEWNGKIAKLKEEIAQIESIHQEYLPSYTHYENRFQNQINSDQQEYEVHYERLLQNHQTLKHLLLNAVSGAKNYKSSKDKNNEDGGQNSLVEKVKAL